MRTRLIIFLILIVVLATPTPAHAIDPLGLASDLGAKVAHGANDILVAIIQLLTNAMSELGSILQSVMGMELTNGGAAVYKIWKLLRDLTSMLFVVLLIGISFATIFGTVIKPLAAFNFRTALVPLIIAALFINMSLSLGQAIVWGGNELTKLVFELLPKDTGIRIATSLNVSKVLAGKKNIPVIPIGSIPLDQLTPTQRVVVEGWLKAPAGSPAAVGLSTLESCLKRNGTPDTCLQQAKNYYQNAVAQAASTEQQRLSQNTGLGALNGVLANAASYWTTRTFTQATPAGSLSDEVAKLADNGVRAFLILVLTLSFLAIVVFMIARIPMVWFLLAVSSAAFFSYAVPIAGASGNFTRWVKNIIGVSLFGPMYLFIIYIGLFVLSTQGSLVASVSDPQNLPFWSSILSTVFFYFIAAFIFVGGAAWVFNFCFKTLGIGAEGGGYLQSALGALGISPERQFGISGVAQRLGITPTAQALQERAVQFGGDIAAGARGRFPILFGTKEEALERARQRFGVRGKGPGLEKVILDRIEGEKKIMEDTVRQRQAEAATRGKTYDDTAYLKQQANSSNRDVALAAKETLLNKGRLDAKEISRTAQEYGRVSPLARQSYVERVSKRLQEKAEKKEFRDSAEVFASLDVLNQSQRDKLLKVIERSQPLVATELAKQGLYMNPDGSKALANDILERNARAIENRDWPKILELAHDDQITMTPQLNQLLAERTKKLSDYLEMVRNAKPDQQIEIAHIAALQEKIQRVKSGRGKKKTI